jgi:FtsP/CotA-like multicopper oxidase with cupredoxin domain
MTLEQHWRCGLICRASRLTSVNAAQLNGTLQSLSSALCRVRFKDTVKANPGQSTTIRAKFDLPTDVTAPQNYVYHCHIVEHEDNDMMRPFTVMP